MTAHIAKGWARRIRDPFDLPCPWHAFTAPGYAHGPALPMCGGEVRIYHTNLSPLIPFTRIPATESPCPFCVRALLDQRRLRAGQGPSAGRADS